MSLVAPGSVQSCTLAGVVLPLVSFYQTSVLFWVLCSFLLLILYQGGASIQEVHPGVRVTLLWNLIGSGSVG